MRPIVTLTMNPAVDSSCEADRVQPLRKVRTRNERYDPGGGGINVARVVNELGGRSFAVYLAGGRPGDVLDELVEAAGVAFYRIRTRERTRVSHVVFEHASGKEFRFTPEGPTLQEREWRAALDFLSLLDFEWLVASGSLPRGVPDDFLVRVAAMAAEKRARLVIDSSGPALRAVLGHGVTLLKPSMGELGELVGRLLTSAEDASRAARDLVNGGAVEMLAVTMGKAGAILATRDGVGHLAAPAVTPRSAVGAGDSFVGAMTLALASGRPADEAFALGIAAGTATVTTPGTELCRRAEVERLFATIWPPR
jgi:6-phosphofructokinase 2